LPKTPPCQKLTGNLAQKELWLSKNSISEQCSEKFGDRTPTNNELNFLDIFYPWILVRFRRNRAFSTSTIDFWMAHRAL